LNACQGDVSGGRNALPRQSTFAHSPPGDLPQLALDRPSSVEQSSIHFIEIMVGRVEHKAARNADRDADGVAIKLDCKALCTHRTLLPVSGSMPVQAQDRAGGASARLIIEEGALATSDARLVSKKP
jgi:hypothetical protein